MSSWFGITDLGNNKYCMMSGPKWTILAWAFVIFCLAAINILNYFQGVQYKDKDGNTVTMKYHTINLIIAIGYIIFGLIFIYAYFRKF